MNYTEARSQIKNLDIIGFCHGDVTLFGKGIRYVQKHSRHTFGGSQYAEITHVGIACWINGRLYVMHEAGVSNVMCYLSQFEDEKLYIFDSELEVEDEQMEMTTDYLMYRKLNYGWGDNLRIFGRLLTGVGANKETPKTLVCSTFAAEALRFAGYVFDKKFPVMPSPSETCSALKLRLIING